MSDDGYRQRVRLEALEIARGIVVREGLAALQARRVAKDAKCSVGSLYNVFGDLDGLILALNVETVGALGKTLAASFAMTRRQPTDERLLDLALSYMTFALAHLNLWKAVFEHRLPDNAEVPPTYRADQARLLALIGEIISGEIAGEDVRACAARALFAAVHGIIALSVDQKLGTFDARALEAEIRFIVKAAANGLKGVG